MIDFPRTDSRATDSRAADSPRRRRSALAAAILTAALVGPIGGWSITQLGYAWTYVLTGLLPLLAIGLVPVHGERRDD